MFADIKILFTEISQCSPKAYEKMEARNKLQKVVSLNVFFKQS